MKSFDLGSYSKYSKDCPNKMDFHKTEGYNAVVVCLEDRVEIAPHSEPYHVLFIVLEGRGIIAHGDRKTEVSPGKAVFVGHDEVRGIKCIERMRLIGIQEAH